MFHLSHIDLDRNANRHNSTQSIFSLQIIAGSLKVKSFYYAQTPFRRAAGADIDESATFVELPPLTQPFSTTYH